MNAAIADMARVDAAVRRFEEASVLMNVLRAVTPCELARHREQYIRDWEQGRPRDPVFTYQALPDDGVRAAETLLADIAGVADSWHELLGEEISRTVDTFRACVSHVPERITEATVREHGRPSEPLLADARALLASPPSVATPEAASLAPAAVASVLAEILLHYGLSDWEVRMRADMAARMSVLAVSRRINLRADVRLSVEGLVQLAVHEIGTHVFRSVNALRGPRILHLRLSGNTATEEGLAVWHEHHVAGANTIDPRFPLRVLAVNRALTGGFTEVVEEVVRYTDIRTAFDLAVRVKRGLINTAVPGGYCKDHVYLSGFHMVRSYLHEHVQDYPALMSAKWPVQRIGLLKTTDLPAALPGPFRLPDAGLAHMIRSLAEQAVTE